MRDEAQSTAGCRARRHSGSSALSALAPAARLPVSVIAMVDIGCPVAFLLYSTLIFLWGSTLPLFSGHIVWMVSPNSLSFFKL